MKYKNGISTQKHGGLFYDDAAICMYNSAKSGNTVHFCYQCGIEHVVSPTVDSTGTVVGYFCNRERLMASMSTGKWNGVNLRELVNAFIDDQLDEVAFSRMAIDRIGALAKRFAYQMVNDAAYADLRLNFAVMQYVIAIELDSRHARLIRNGGDI